MKREKSTPQEIADRHDCYVAMDRGGAWYGWEHHPTRTDQECWFADGALRWLNGLYDVQWQGGWEDSLHEPTPQLLPCPDGHEAHVVREVPHAYCTNEYGATTYQLTLPSHHSYRDLTVAWNAMVTALKEERNEMR